MTRAPRVAIVGAGLMGRWHAHAARRAGGRVSVVVDADGAAAARLASHAAAPASATTLDGFDAAGPIDVVHVCTPLAAHAEVVLGAVSRARVVIVEKPVAATAAETRRLLAGAAAHGCLVVPVHQTAWQAGVQEAMRWMRGAPLRVLDYRACSAGASAAPEMAESIAADILPHPLSLVDTFLPGALGTLGWHVERTPGGEIVASAVAGETTVRLLISMHARPPRHDLTLLGDRYTVTADLFHGFAWKARGTVSRAAKIARPFTDAATAAASGAINLARRTARAEPAYPGLFPLVARAYAALDDPSRRPFTDEHTLAVAQARDAILGLQHRG